MRKQITFLLLMLFVTLVSTQVNAQVKEVLYLNNANAQQEEGTSAPGDDVVTRMLNADANFNVTAGTIDGSGTITPSDLTLYDLIIVQETVSSGSAAFIPDAGPLALKNLSVPVIYCKSEAFRTGKAVTSAGAAIASNKSSISVTVPAANQSNELFNGIDFSGGDEIRLFYETANGNGTPGNDGLKVLNNLEISPAVPTLATTPEVTDVNSSVVISYFPAGTQLGTEADDKAFTDIAVFAFSYGVQVKGDGANMTSEALTIWRNTAYKLTGLTVPTTIYENPNEAKQVLYVNQIGVGQGADASAPGMDPVIEMLKADPQFIVTYIESDQAGTEVAAAGISNFDLIIAQETFSSGSALFKPGGVLGVKDVTVPIIYNKSWAFRNTRAITDADADVTATQNVSVTVDPTNQSNPIFSGIDFSHGNDVRIFRDAIATDDGSTGGNKAIDVLNDLEISPAAGTLATVPEVTDASKAFVINYLPTGTQLGENSADVLKVDAVALSFSYGATILGDGANISPQALTIWRNAAYMLTGKTPPTTLVSNDDFVLPKKILYLNQVGVGQGVDASAPGMDPVIKMLMADSNFEVTYMEVDQNGTGLPTLTDFDLIIAQETFSSGSGLFKPGGALGVKDVRTPIIYNKTWAFRNTRAITDADADVTATQNLSVTATNTAHPLFKGIDFSAGNDIRIFGEATAQDDGSVGGNKAIDVLNDIDISNAAAASIATTPEVTDVNSAFVINYIPSGTQLGENADDVLHVNAIALSFSYGAMILGDGANISPEALTIWRNSAYMLAYGPASVPDTLVDNPDFTLSIDKVGEASNVSSNVRAIGNRIYVSNVKSATSLNIYSITGALVKTLKINSDTNFYFNSGIYIATVKTFEGEKAVKLLVR